MAPTGTIQAHGVLPDLNGPHKMTYDVTIFGKTVFTTVTASPEAVDDWIQEFLSMYFDHPHHLAVGLETERGPYEHRIATVQFCVDRRCLVFQIGRSPSVPPSLLNFLSDAKKVFVGIRINSQVLNLQGFSHFIRNARYYDLGNLMARRYNRPELRYCSLTEFTLMVLGKPLEMPGVDMYWNQEELSEEQVHYACLEAYLAYEITRKLLTQSLFF